MRRSNYEMVRSFVENPGVRGRSYSVRAEDGVLYSYGEHYPLLVPTASGHYLLNTDGYSVTTAHHISMARREAGRNAVDVPFSRLPFDVPELRKSEVLGRDEDYTLLRVPGTNDEEKPQDRFFLMGPDETYKVKVQQREWARPWVAELRKPVKDVEEALESLKPPEVREAERFGIEVIRQGDFFFVWTTDRRPRTSWDLTKPGERYALARSHSVLEAIKARIEGETVMLVRGGVTHGEHRTITLDQWYRPLRCTARRIPGARFND